MKIVLFRMGPHYFGIPVEQVCEVIPSIPATPLPQAPPYIFGTIPFRHRHLVVVSLANRLGLSSRNPSFPYLLVVRILEKAVGILVDQVMDLIEVEKAGSKADRISTEFLEGIYDWKEQTVLVLDLPKLFS